MEGFFAQGPVQVEEVAARGPVEPTQTRAPVTPGAVQRRLNRAACYREYYGSSLG